MLSWLKWAGLAAAGIALAFVLAPMMTTDDVAQARKTPKDAQRAVASWYGPGFHGQETASGEQYDQNELTAAHKELPLGTIARVTNLDNGKSVRVEINDRGPYVGGRIIDVSKAAAERLGMKQDGTTPVRVEVIATPPVDDGSN